MKHILTFAALVLATSCFGQEACPELWTACGEGTVWDEESQTCIVANVSDTDFDGCVGINDFLIHLSNFGSGCGPELPWSCGDQLEYQGYDYETVQVGEQCWFAENLRSEFYQNGDAIPTNLGDDNWENTSSGAVAVYGEGESSCQNWSPDGDACDENWSLIEYGRLYNGYCVEDGRSLCPSGWHVPSDGEWMTMEMALGMSEAEANNQGWRGTDQGTQMKTEYGYFENGNGTNLSGFRGLPGACRGSSFNNAGRSGYWWSSTMSESNITHAWVRIISFPVSTVLRSEYALTFGYSVRCIQDSE